MSILSDRAFNASLSIAALAIAASVVYRTFGDTPKPNASESLQPTYLPYWQEALPLGRRIGPVGAPVTIVELVDLECPACRGFHSALKEVTARFPNKVATVVLSHPLPQHRFALPAARAAECAQGAGKYAEWIDAVYAKQDSLGLRSWGEFAHDAGINDTSSIAKCATGSANYALISAGKAFGARIGLRGTPTVIVNGWMLAGTPSSEELSREVGEIVAGRRPFGK